MKLLVKHRFRVWVLIGLVTFSVTAVAHPAQADPHAVFLTVVGQQQLFFNVLAALNQADYVETLQLRQQLAQKRDANYVPSSAAALRDSQTDLASLLTRSVTLEGQDVATQERAGDYAKEVGRQQQLANLIGQLCREAFGSKNCELEQGPAQQGQQDQILDERERAFVQNPAQDSYLPAILGSMAVLLSGTSQYQDAAKATQQAAEQGGPILPLAYSTQIAQLRQRYPDRNDPKRKLIEQAIQRVAMEYVGPRLNQPLDNVTISEDGQIGFIPPSSINGRPPTPAQQIASHREAINQTIDLRPFLRDIADSAAGRISVQLSTVDGAVPDKVQRVLPGFGSDELGEIETVITAPANVKVGLQQQLLPLLAQIEGNPQFVDPSQIGNPAGESAVDRQGKAPLKIGTPLQPFSENDIIKKGLFEQTGLTKEPGLRLNTLQNLIQQIVNKVKK